MVVTTLASVCQDPITVNVIQDTGLEKMESHALQSTFVLKANMDVNIFVSALQAHIYVAAVPVITSTKTKRHVQ